MSDELAEYLQRALRAALLLGDDEYLDAFDRFEFMLGLVHADIRLQQSSHWGPIGSFGWRAKYVDRAWGEATAQEPSGHRSKVACSTAHLTD